MHHRYAKIYVLSLWYFGYVYYRVSLKYLDMLHEGEFCVGLLREWLRMVIAVYQNMTCLKRIF
jgi:hypothetical protein